MPLYKVTVGYTDRPETELVIYDKLGSDQAHSVARNFCGKNFVIRRPGAFTFGPIIVKVEKMPND